MQPFQANLTAMVNCLKKAGLPTNLPYETALVWANSSWVNRLNVQAEALRLIGIELDPELYQEALERAKRADAATYSN